MCFYQGDADWCAMVNEVTDAESGPAFQCEECCCKYGENDWRRLVFQQEHEECQLCEDDSGDGYVLGENDEPPPRCVDGEHSYGETYTATTCRSCVRFREAVVALEKEEGCPADEQQPCYGHLWDDVNEADEPWKYAHKAIAMFPHLAEFGDVRQLLDREREKEATVSR